GGGGTSMLIMLVAIFAIFYFLMIRPESKRRKERQSMIDSLARGDKVVTIGGLYGEVQDVHDDKIVIRIAENLKVEVAKTAISGKRD
ncbi:MAG: preprotein translocase subunit YajC, partial [Candidatus Eisenbacteria bacterium]|nr:preprotein translocase subunit YajC [Candidatus Eisenbacteria bacterium]